MKSITLAKSRAQKVAMAIIYGASDLIMFVMNKVRTMIGLPMVGTSLISQFGAAYGGLNGWFNVLIYVALASAFGGSLLVMLLIDTVLAFILVEYLISRRKGDYYATSY